MSAKDLPPDVPMLETILNQDESQMLRSLLGGTFDAAYFVNKDRKILAWNQGAMLLTGYRSEEVVHRCCSDNILVHVDDSGMELCKNGCPLKQVLQDGNGCEASVLLRHKLGYRVPVSIRIVPIRNEKQEIAGAVEFFRTTNQAEFWKHRIAELETLAFVDPVTAVPNRRFMETQIDHQIHELHAAGAPFAACMLDIDHFKDVNDRYGHEAGDRLLQTVCQTLLNCMRAVDMLGRWGGDELLLLLPRTTLAQVQQIVERMRAIVAETSVATELGFVKTTVSIGAAVSSDFDDRNSILQRADAQLYLAKAHGRNRCHVV
jgi:diguanylate cyclase (GGDEF)-like protein/PAS domain S-box-containing protein